jgi:hypothetical protein
MDNTSLRSMSLLSRSALEEDVFSQVQDERKNATRRGFAEDGRGCRPARHVWAEARERALTDAGCKLNGASITSTGQGGPVGAGLNGAGSHVAHYPHEVKADAQPELTADSASSAISRSAAASATGPLRVSSWGNRATAASLRGSSRPC